MHGFKRCSEQGPNSELAPGSDETDSTSTTHELRTVRPTLMEAVDTAAVQTRAPKIRSDSEWAARPTRKGDRTPVLVAAASLPICAPRIHGLLIEVPQKQSHSGRTIVSRPCKIRFPLEAMLGVM